MTPPTHRSLCSGCGIFAVAIVLEVDAVYVDLEEVPTGGVKPSHREVDTVHLLCTEETRQNKNCDKEYPAHLSER